MDFYCINGCRYLEEIVYKGSLAEWEKVEKYPVNREDDDSVTIVCNDGKTTFKF